MSKKQIMAMGDEAIAHAAIDAGIKGAFAYPGTPSTEVYETAEHIIKKLQDGRVAQIGANEKVAYEFALGASYAGFRTIVTMKHVGLNVAMDAFVNSGITGINGGLVVLVADDPGMHSSQNEQDSRYLADFALIPCLEPATPQEAYDFTFNAFELSEKLKLPVMIRVVTRLAHSRGPVNKLETKAPVSYGVPSKEEKRNWVLIPANARVQYQKLRDKFPRIVETLSEYNKLELKGSRIGVVTCGMGNAYFDQVARSEKQLTELSRFSIEGYPLDQQKLEQICNNCDQLYVFEENYPFIEDQLLKLTRKAKIKGRRDGSLPIAGELNMEKVKLCLGIDAAANTNKVSMDVPNRPPRLCDGCGHVDAFKALRQAFLNLGIEDYRIFGDIGCYTLGTLPPFDSIHACVEMGASVGMTMGAALSGMNQPAVGVIGDSTFFHSGLPTLVTLAQSKVNATIVIMDNRITAMTGAQPTVGHDMFEKLAQAVGLSEQQIHVLTPLPKNHQENVKRLEQVLQHQGPDLVIFKRDCIQAMRRGVYKQLGI